jgi:hypothetical protein
VNLGKEVGKNNFFSLNKASILGIVYAQRHDNIYIFYASMAKIIMFKIKLLVGGKKLGATSTNSKKMCFLLGIYRRV